MNSTYQLTLNDQCSSWLIITVTILKQWKFEPAASLQSDGWFLKGCFSIKLKSLLPEEQLIEPIFQCLFTMQAIHYIALTISHRFSIEQHFHCSLQTQSKFCLLLLNTNHSWTASHWTYGTQSSLLLRFPPSSNVCKAKHC